MRKYSRQSAIVINQCRTCWPMRARVATPSQECTLYRSGIGDGSFREWDLNAATTAAMISTADAPCSAAWRVFLLDLNGEYSAHQVKWGRVESSMARVRQDPSALFSNVAFEEGNSRKCFPTSGIPNPHLGWESPPIIGAL